MKHRFLGVMAAIMALLATIAVAKVDIKAANYNEQDLVVDTFADSVVSDPKQGISRQTNKTRIENEQSISSKSVYVPPHIVESLKANNLKEKVESECSNVSVDQETAEQSKMKQEIDASETVTSVTTTVVTEEITPSAEDQDTTTKAPVSVDMEEEKPSAHKHCADNWICIPGTDLCAKVTPASFTQVSVDTYDVVYSEKMSSGHGPFVLGHDYRSMGCLYQTEIGDEIHLCIDGKTTVYIVEISEYAIFDTKTIWGRTSGYSVFDNLDGEGETLHLYTCYGEDKAGRWLVLAKEVLS